MPEPGSRRPQEVAPRTPALPASRALTGLPRAGQLGLVAKDLAVARCRRPGPARDRVLGDVARRLGLLHGLPQKLGQLLAFSEVESSDPAFLPLTESAPTLATEAATTAIEQALGGPWSLRFREISPDGISASIGQVHKALLKDGRTVAVKVQYPGIAECVEWDLKALGWLASPLTDLRRGFDMAAYRREIGLSLRRELDYTREAMATRRFAAWTRGWNDVLVPEVIPDCTRGGVLTTTWIEGSRLAEARGWSSEERRSLARTLVRLFLHGLFRWQAVHADPHPGNYRFVRTSSGPKVGVLDFGCMQTIGAEWISGFSVLMDDVAHGRDTDASLLGAYAAMGFQVEMLEGMLPKLRALTRILAEPFLLRGDFDVACWRLGERLAEVLGDDRMHFRTAGPPSLIFILRAFQGLIQYLKALAVPVPWRAAWEEVRPTGSPRPASVRTSVAPATTPGMGGARSLFIQVRESGRDRVQLTFPCAAMDSLGELMPADVLDRLEARGVDVGEMSARAAREGFRPGEVFRLEEGTRSVRVWLE